MSAEGIFCRRLQQCFKFPGQSEVLARQPAGVVRRQREFDFVPADVDVGMMPCSLSQACDGIHKPDGSREVLELKHSVDAIAAWSPVRQPAQAKSNFSNGELCHASLFD